jgi:hypothetical protein
MNAHSPLDCGSGCRGFDPRHSPLNTDKTPGADCPLVTPGVPESPGYSPDSVQEALGDLLGKLLPSAEWGHYQRVYFIGCDRFVKIGFTDRLTGRLRELRAATPYSLDVLAVFAGNQGFERELHKRFAGLHHQREWFHREGALASFVDSPEVRAARQVEAPRPALSLLELFPESAAIQADPARRLAFQEECYVASFGVSK